MSKKLIIFFLLIILATISFFVIVKPVSINGSAMAPSYKDGERFLANKTAYLITKPKRGDVIIYHFPQNSNVLFIGRIVALPGEKLKIQGGRVYINQTPLVEEYLALGTTTTTSTRREFEDLEGGLGKLVETNEPKILEEGQEIFLNEDSYFVMGDNRSESIDSRSLGLVKSEGVLGKLIFRY